MKLILLVLLLSFIGCTPPKPEFVVGDCIQRQWHYSEYWEQNAHIEKITEIGKYSYHTMFYLGGRFTYSLPSLDRADFSDNYKKVTCPKEVK